VRIKIVLPFASVTTSRGLLSRSNEEMGVHTTSARATGCSQPVRRKKSRKNRMVNLLSNFILILHE
jgi:hypothetical protein